MTAMPFFSINVAAWIVATSGMTLKEIGAFQALLMTMAGSPAHALPDDDARLARCAKCKPAEWQEIRRVLAPTFIIANGEWRHEWIEKEIAFIAEKRAKKKHAADVRWQAKPLENAKSDDAPASHLHMQRPMQNDATFTSPSPSQTESTTPPPSLNAARAEAEPPKGGVGFDPRFQEVVGRAERILNNPRCFVWSKIDVWLKAGADPEMDIYPVLERMKSTWESSNLVYFERSIMSATRARQSPISEVPAGRSAAGPRIPTKADIDEMERINANLIRERGRQHDISAVAVRQMVRKKLLTADEATKAGYQL